MEETKKPTIQFAGASPDEIVTVEGDSIKEMSTGTAQQAAEPLPDDPAPPKPSTGTPGEVPRGTDE